MNQSQAFEEGLRKSLESDPSLSRRGKRLLDILNSKPSKRRTRQLDRMERHARAGLGLDKIDWSTVDWAKIIELILKILLAILPLIMTEEPQS